MNGEVLFDRSTSPAAAENWLALGTGALLLLVGTPEAALASPQGAAVKPAALIGRASPLDRVRVDSTDRILTSNQGVPIADNQSSLKAGLRGSTLLEDFILREITHVDHERIPERTDKVHGLSEPHR